jgi:hypothetical protein
LRHLYIKTIILSRQARDKHRKNSKKSGVFLRTRFVSTSRSLWYVSDSFAAAPFCFRSPAASLFIVQQLYRLVCPDTVAWHWPFACCCCLLQGTGKAAVRKFIVDAGADAAGGSTGGCGTAAAAAAAAAAEPAELIDAWKVALQHHASGGGGTVAGAAGHGHLTYGGGEGG